MKAPTLVLLTALAGLASAAAITQPAGLVERDCHQIFGVCKVTEDCCGDLICFTHTNGEGSCADIPSA
ncbi:hypothetical protein BDV27DRAFT_164322 [Aspergillus caelatus]|uniref:Uncharacterized protein n=2 Tax=Aspergillus subgen. Circumdati TaxID=2720871 RepID=A0A5N6ZJJ8_9EURO|nr:uncharacterized protein BDV27DRAFT_164322 [Aspergillus caelatus]KAE8357645.1 hypothetical protein BDV27DRAFT_164322 [Aspergillus caelatus]KAE8414371.1 hypothetical protein BDV36DRAFT_299104 [Aspergillus pseudocaelatus]